MKIISAQKLKEKMDRGDNFKLIMALDRNAYELVHIPGSLYFDDIAEAAKQLDPKDEIVVYCTNPACSASVHAYLELQNFGFDNLSRFAGGLEAWSKAGYPLEGLIFSNSTAETLVPAGLS